MMIATGVLARMVTLLALMLMALVPISPLGVAAQGACEPADGGGATTAAEASPVSVPEKGFPDEGGDLRVFAAASLVDVFDEIVTDIQAEHPNVSITVETAGSQALVTQLQEGAGADVLATANTSTMATAVESGLIASEPTIFTGNRLVIVAPDGNPAGIESLNDLATDGVRLVLAGAAVPVGSYARASLCAYEATDAAPAGFIDGINGNVVSEEVDVRSVLAKVQLGEADAGVVYASDAVASGLAGTPLMVIEFPEAVNVTAAYPIAPVADGNVELANAFISYVLSSVGQAALESFGFVNP